MAIVSDVSGDDAVDPAELHGCIMLDGVFKIIES
jgi:hypothetical protein